MQNDSSSSTEATTTQNVLTKQVEVSLRDFEYSLDTIDESVLMFDANGLELFYSNLAGQKLLECSERQLIGATLPELIYETERDRIYSFLGECYQGKKSSSMFETIFVNGGGYSVPVEMDIEYLVSRQGVDRFLIVLKDVSERAKQDRERAHLQTQLLHAQKLGSVGQLASGIAHEINTPSQFVVLNVEFLNEAFGDIAELINEIGKKTDSAPLNKEEFEQLLEEKDWAYLQEEIPSAMQQSKAGLERIRSTVMAMKDFSHSGGQKSASEDLNRLIETTVMVTRNEWKYVAEFVTELDVTLPVVPCFGDELNQVFLSLIINSVHAIEAKFPEGVKEEKGSISIASRLAGDFAEIVVTDTGVGIPEDIQHHIFDPCSTTEEVRTGLGQGLAICRDIIESKHGGTLTLSSKENVGTTFVIRLPLKVAR